VTDALSSGNRDAISLFAPIAPNYDRWSALLSLGQDPRWRATMVSELALPPRARVLDVAAGTGLITRLLQARGHDVVSLDLSEAMLSHARQHGTTVVATAEALPFPDETFDALTFGYLLRYVSDPLATMRELARVLSPGGTIGMVEFGRPRGLWRPLWWLYTRAGLPAAGVLAGAGWSPVGAFLGPSIDAFHERFPRDVLVTLWEAAGLTDVRYERHSLGGGLVMRARRR
jgi:demethylmenaquinone methyltransferase/2-methoxy-6-polyprenyl-1,4-benzoquinol methylase